MFTKDDYINYFGELEGILKESIAICTNVLNEAENKTLRSKIDVLASENMETFRFVKSQKKKFAQKEDF
jgi:hypothetical protein